MSFNALIVDDSETVRATRKSKRLVRRGEFVCGLPHVSAKMLQLAQAEWRRHRLINSGTIIHTICHVFSSLQWSATTPPR